jgi:hypothetical protein
MERVTGRQSMEHGAWSMEHGGEQRRGEENREERG